VLEERPVVLERLLQVLGAVRRAEPAPGDEVGARRDRGGRVDLEERQVLHHGEQVVRAARIEELCADRDPPGFGAAQAV